MERLTGSRITLSDGTEYYDLEALGGESCGEHCNAREYCEGCSIQKAFNRLAAYEDTGLEPQKIAARTEEIKRIFRERYKKRKETPEEIPAGFDKLKIVSAMDELTEIYSRIFGISYDDAAKELHDQPENQKERGS